MQWVGSGWLAQESTRRRISVYSTPSFKVKSLMLMAFTSASGSLNLQKIPLKYIHEPWKAPANVLLEAGIVLGESYPLPIIDHSLARIRALEAYARVKNKT